MIEGWGDDVPDGKVTDFRRAVQATAEETVAFAWVEWPNKATRDAAMKKMVEDPRMDPSTPGNPPMPFDGKRMIFGGFEQVVEVKAERRCWRTLARDDAGPTVSCRAPISGQRMSAQGRLRVDTNDR